jgi:hypothetical protein
VRSIRFAFLFVSPTQSAALADDKRAKDAKGYVLNDVTVGPFPDRLIRRAFTMTVSMRNRTP